MTASRGPMVVAGVMSGTSADGVDVALCRIGDPPDGQLKIKVLGHRAYPYPPAVRKAVLGAMEGDPLPAAEWSRLHWRLGALYAECVAQACTSLAIHFGAAGGGRPRLALIGMHGQTVYHQASARRYLGAPVRCTWQVGEAAVVAEQLRTPVVSDLRPADLAAGGQGAPLVPMLDLCLFRSNKIGRVLQNLGGIGNLTAIPAGAAPQDVLAFDTGPGNMVIDHCMRTLFAREFDRDGAVARRGRVLDFVVTKILRSRYFSAPPPKSCGREQFGAAFGQAFVQTCRSAGATDADVVATATALTARSIAVGYQRFVHPHVGPGKVDLVAAGGGAKNTTLMRMLHQQLEPMGVRVRTTDAMGVAVEAKEAVAFALLAWLTWQRRPGNLPAATGAAHPVVLGKVSLA